MREELEARAPGMLPEQRTALARVAGGRLDRVTRLLDPAATKRRDALLALARDVYRDPAFEPAGAAQRLLAAAAERGDDARAGEEQELERLDLTQREADQRLRRAQRGAEREELLASLEELEAWYRDLVVVATGARARRDPLRPPRRAARGRDASSGSSRPSGRASSCARCGASSRSST